ncbi:hypothetical protein ABT160_37950 [Streptomyces sp. NPDC001941]|uniref:hypothetical protein n=1 Tax=Streptomyces sp. NPDC001941 TaxID=3154659 RepID=UPI00331C3761
MAATSDPHVRDRIAAYAETTPEPPPLGSHGIETTGCPRCRGTMWRQRDLFVCSACGDMKGADPMTCPRCLTAMKPPAPGRHPHLQRYACPFCPRKAAPGDTREQIEERERQRARAVRLLDAAIQERPSAQALLRDRRLTAKGHG